MPNIWVFPGGRIEEADGPGDLGARRAAIRETHEEAGIALAADHPAAYFARWVTPTGERRRFDTRFFLSEVDAETSAVADQGEVIEARWVRPEEAISRHARGELSLAPPTLWAFEALRRLGHARAMLDWAHSLERAGVEAVTPQLALVDGTVEVSVPPDRLGLPPGEPVSGRLRLVKGIWQHA
jgi:ADP-ribose pyrophosphatase YjhB (NUDIX family)